MTIEFAAETPETLSAEPAEEPGAGPAVMYTAYFSAIDELVEHIRAAEVLNLGFRVESYLVTPEDAPDTTQVEFEFTLLSELPARDEERD
ncbi:hypothetical protein ACQP1P_22135 [Dactylosporangium sp. CA-052675]|uniref:hypothetical protein n=1 Tax=unclassified Dactylosporangium TaxID=2621675 RepID=UPI00332D9BC7|nr:hypothetical protein GCM10020063_024210 [Dactylosporangium thailandense]